MANTTISDIHFGLRDFLGRVRTTGRTFFVSSTATGASDSDGRSGRDANNPLATIDAAFGSNYAGSSTGRAAGANNGDIIVVMPNHAETLTAAAQMVMDVAGVHVFGIGTGGTQPTITLGTATTTDVDIDAADITVENIHFVANLQDIAVCLDVNAADFTCRGCRFTDNSTALNFLVCVQDAAGATSDRITVENCRVYGLDLSDTHFVNFGGTGTGHVIQDNILNGTWATMCIGGAGVVINCMILRNSIYNIAAGADLCISMAATATGLIAWNACCGGHATDGIVNGDLGAIENYYEDHQTDLSGSLEPAVA